MEIFKDSPENTKVNFDIKYNEIIFNQVTYNPKKDLLAQNTKNDINIMPNIHESSKKLWSCDLSCQI